MSHFFTAKPSACPTRTSRRGAGPGRVASILIPSLLLAACGGSDDGDASGVATSSFTYASDAPLAAAGSFAVTGALESVSGDLNGDGDSSDRVAVALRYADGQEFVTGAAASEAAVLGDAVYLIVDEAGNNDWNSNATPERVLLRFTATSINPAFIAVLRPGSEVVSVANRLWFVEDSVPSMAAETNLRYIDEGSIATPMEVPAGAGKSGSFSVSLVGAEDGMLFVALDEADNGDQNGDLDDTDSAVLALVEANVASPEMISVGLAMPAANSVVRARSTGVGLFNVAFLVDEAQQGDVNLNAGVTLPTLCSNAADGDTNDAVLHLLQWEFGGIAAATDPPANTGLNAGDTPGNNRLLISNEALGIITSELTTGADPGCDLNGDGDTNDSVLRWARVSDPTNPETSPGVLRAVATNLPGGARGAIELGGQFVIASNETVDVDGTMVTDDFVFWADPTTDTSFDSEVFDPGDATLVVPLQAAIDWMSSDQESGRNPVGLTEAGFGSNLNRGCNGATKDNGTADTSDTVASWLFYDSGQDVVRVAGLGFAVQTGNSGLTIAGGQAFFRVDESDDGVDWNADGDQGDQVLFRSPVNACSPFELGTLNDIAGAPAVFSDGVFGAVFLASETDENRDLNLDGVVSGFAARFLNL